MEYEIALNDSDGIRFLPWIGNKYGENSRFGIGVLVLGEAHYGSKRDYTKSLTRDYTGEYIRGCWNHRFWTGIGQVLMGCSQWDFERSELWDHIAFYNYLQWFAAEGPRQAPQKKFWNQSEQPFKLVLHILKPKLVLVLGERLWSWLPTEDRPGSTLQIEGETQTRETCLYATGPGTFCLAGRIRHPSAAFSWSKWYPYVKAYLHEADQL